MDDSLKKIINHLGQWNPSFGYANPTKDSVSINVVGMAIPVNRMVGSTQKLTTFTTYCFYDKFIDSFTTANNIYGYLQTHKIIDNQLKISNITAPQRVTMKQNKHLFVVEFQVMGL